MHRVHNKASAATRTRAAHLERGLALWFIASLLEEAETGDSIIVSELSQLGRSMLECIEILSIATQKGYAVKGH